MAFTLDQINALFTGPLAIQGSLWNRWGENRVKEAAIIQAEADLNQIVNQQNVGLESTDDDYITWDYDTSEAGDTIRMDWAVAFQALHILNTSMALADGTQSGPKYIATDGQGEDQETPPRYSKTSLVWLTGCVNPTDITGLMNLPHKLTMDRG